MLKQDRSSVVASSRILVAATWGEMGQAWGVPPAVARVHGYLLACRRPVSEREVRDALELSHRAAAMALDRAVEVGLAARVPGARIGSRGPIGAAFLAIEDEWAWFGRVAAERKAAEIDPAVVAIGERAAEVAKLRRAQPDDRELAELGDWLDRLHGSLVALDRALAIVPALAPRDLEALVRVAGRVSPETLARLLQGLAELPEDDVAALADAVSRIPAGAIRPSVKALAKLGRKRHKKAGH